MKTINRPAASKLVARFDQELLEILRTDLKALKQVKNQFLNNVNNNLLPAA